jgi:hypothetical protein
MVTKMAVPGIALTFIIIVFLAIQIMAPRTNLRAIQTTATTTVTDFLGHIHTISWSFKDDGYSTSAKSDTTSVTATVDGDRYNAGIYNGICIEIGSSGNTGLVGDEISAIQCWSATGGHEVGVFAEGDRLILEQSGLLQPQDRGADFRGSYTTVFELSSR